MNYVYILRCGDGSLYTGWTNDLDARLEAHRSGRGAKYTRSHLPVELAYCEEYETKEAAMSREWQIKRLTRRLDRKEMKNAPHPRDLCPADGVRRFFRAVRH